MKHIAIAPTRIKLNAGGGVFILWNDGHQAVYPYGYLRRKCPCATCEDSPPDVVEESPLSLPILGQRAVKAVGADPVGHYAIQFKWNDGHQAGLYSFEYLRRICPCETCAPTSE